MYLGAETKYTLHKVKRFVEPPLISRSLTFCSLSENQIKDDGVRALSEALRVNQSLQELKWVQYFMSLFFLRNVHCSVVPRYRIAENFWGRKLSRILWFCHYTRKFSTWNLGCDVLWHCKSEQSAKVFSAIVFSPIRRSFLPWKFPAIRYVLKFIGRACRWHLEIYHSCSNLWKGKTNCPFGIS